MNGTLRYFQSRGTRLARALRSPTTLFSAVVAAWLVWLAIDLLVLSLGGLPSAGLFGDWFGGINALFTALAFSAVTWSAFMQRREMAMQRRELRAQRAELKLQREAVELQRNEMELTRNVVAKQTFEATFFRMLDEVRERHAAVAVRYVGPGTHTLHDDLAFRDLADACAKFLEFEASDGTTDEEVRHLVGRSYSDEIYKHHEHDLAPYFRTLFHLFKLIDRQDSLSLTEKRDYSNLVRAQFNSNDLVVLAANGCSRHGDGMRKYIVTFRLLKHLSLENYDHMAVLRRCYPAETFEAYPVIEPHSAANGVGLEEDDDDRY